MVKRRRLAEPFTEATRKRKYKYHDFLSSRTTRRSVPAREAVFKTAELLENILVYLPPLQLFAIKRVSQQFQAAVNGSLPLRRRQFLDLDDNPTAKWRLDYRGSIPNVEPFWERLPLDTPSTASKTLHKLSFRNIVPTYVYPKTPARLCPLLYIKHHRYCGAEELQPSAARHWRCSVEECEMMPGLQLPVPSPLLNNKKGQQTGPSWRDIHLTDPLCNAVGVRMEFQVPDQIGCVSASVRQVLVEDTEGSGLTMGDIVDAIVRIKSNIIVSDGQSRRILKSRAVHSYLKRATKEHGADPVVVSAYFNFGNLDVVFPDESEWR